jgi:hypothetical protein
MALRKASLNVASRAYSPALKATRSSQTVARSYATALPDKKNSSNDNYISPFQDIFDTITKGNTFLGDSSFKFPEIKHLKCGVPEFALRYKTTTYGRLLEEPFVRPNEHRVTLQVATQYLPLNNMEMMVLKEIVGTRLNTDKGVLQLSSVQFGSRIENKRHLVSMLDRLVDSAKTMAERLQDEDPSQELS